MKLVSFSESDGHAGPNLIRPGILLDKIDIVLDLATEGHADVLAAISAGVTAHEKGDSYWGYPLSNINLHAPLPNPPRIFCIGLNYRDHAKELRVNAICPGTVETPFVEGYLDKYHAHEKEKIREELRARQPMGRLGQPEEVASMVRYLSSREAGFISGSLFTLDGGWTAA